MADRTLSLRVLFAGLDRLSSPLRNIRGGARDTARAIADTRREITALKRSQASLGAFRDLERQLQGTSQKLEVARTKVANLRTAIASADGPTTKLTRSLAAAERQESRLVQQHEAHGRELQDLSRRLESTGIDVADLARHEDRLANSIYDANRRLDQQTDQLERNARARARVDRARETGQSIREGGYTAIAAGTVIAAPLVAAGVSAANFQTSLTDIAQKADITRERAAALGREFDRIGPRVAQSAANIAGGVDTLLGLGANLPQSMDAIEPIGRAATAYRAEVNDLASATFASLQNLNVQARETGRTLDIMAQAGKSGAFELRDMAQYFPQLTASAQALGQRGVPAVADLAAALQITRRATGDSATAANNLQNLLNKINTRDTIQNFRRFGVDLPRELRRAAERGKSPIEAIAELTNRALGGDLSRLSFLFGDAQVQAALRPLVQGLNDYRQIRADALRAQGTVERDFVDRQRDTAAQWNTLKARAEALGHTIGNALLPAANSLMETIGGLALRFSAWAERHPTLVAWLAKGAAVIAILLIVLGGLAVAIGTVIGPLAYLRFMFMGAWPIIRMFGTGLMWVLRIIPALAAGIRFLGLAFMRAGVMMLANPVVLVITAIVAAIALAAYFIWKHWDRIKAIFNSVVGWLGRAWERIKSIVITGALWLTAPIRMQATAALAAWNWFRGAIDPAINWLAGAWQTIKGIVITGALWLTAPIRLQVAVLRTLWEWIKGIFNGALAFLQSLPSRFYTFGYNVIMGLVRGLTAPLRLLQATVTGIGNRVSGWFSNTLGIRSPSRVFAELGTFVTQGLQIGIDRGAGRPIARVQALGRDLTAALALGAATPAIAATPPTITPVPRLAPTAAAQPGSGGGSTYRHYEIHIHQLPGQDAQDLAREVADEIDRRERLQAAQRRSEYDDDV